MHVAKIAVTTYCVHTFFDHYLNRPGGLRLTIASPLYPENRALE
jgi:hypothetical protein